MSVVAASMQAKSQVNINQIKSSKANATPARVKSEKKLEQSQ